MKTILEEPIIRKARPGEEAAIHEAHMRSIREICVKDHGEEEVRGWGNRPLGTRWIDPIKEGTVWVVEFKGEIHGHGYIRISEKDGQVAADLNGLYLTPDVLHQGQGRKLAILMIDYAKKLGAKSISLVSSITAQEFYKKMGFVSNGPLKYSEFGGSSVRGYPMILHLRDEGL